MRIVHDEAAGSTATELEEELTLLGITASTRIGTRSDARKVRDSQKFDAVVHVQSGKVRVWMMDNQVRSGDDVRAEAGESSEMLALRAAELIRARLLPAGARLEQPAAQPSNTGGVLPRWVEVSTGPLILLRGYGQAGVGWSGDVSWVHQGLRVGAYLEPVFSRSPWHPAPDHFSFHEFGAGVRISSRIFALLERKLKLFVVGKAGVSSVTLRTESGPPGAQFEASYAQLTLRTGLRLQVTILHWLYTGAFAVGGIGLPLSRVDSQAAEHPPQRQALEEWAARPVGLGAAAWVFGLHF